MAIVDVSKAFDLVSHGTFLSSAKTFGAPDHLLTFLSRACNTATVQLGSQFIHPIRGVRQDDPISPLLFIMPIDEIVATLPDVGLQLPSVILNHLVYADDMILRAPDRKSLQEKLVALSSRLLLAVFSINSNKSRILVNLSDRKWRTVALDPRPMDLLDSQIPPIRTDEELKYLSV